ncbi:MAG: HD domain-containing protein [Candidatus Saccharibacteria bacterium]
MKIADIVYGETEYIEPVILELLNAPAVNRLKGISQFGIPDKYYFKIGFSRYEHSIGVMNFLKKFGASTEEQIAGLIHDVSHFSFSHISDWIFSNGSKGNESYHDSQHNDFVLNTEIPKILAKYNYSINRILDEDNFPLLENELPNICADRIDYSLREIAHNGGAREVSQIISGLTKMNDKIVFKDVGSALLFSSLFLDLQTTH